MDSKTPNSTARSAYRIKRIIGFLSGPLRASITRSASDYIPPVHLFCDSCCKHISSNADWVCAYCDNVHTVLASRGAYSFLNKCAFCDTSPKSFICPHRHCGVINVLHASSSKEPPARIVLRIEEEKVPQASTEVSRLKHLEEKLKLEREIEIAALNKRLAQLKLSPEFKQEVSIREKQEKDYSNFSADKMGIQMLERKERAKIADECRDDLEMMEMRNLTLDAFVLSHGLEPARKTTQ
jgi:hypothetical protein